VLQVISFIDSDYYYHGI